MFSPKMNGIKLVLKLEFGQENWALQWKPSRVLILNIIFSSFSFFEHFNWMKILISIIILFYKFVYKIIMFQEALQFHSLIFVVKVIGRMPPLLIWQIFHIIMDFFFHLSLYVFLINQCVDINYLVMHYIFAISMSLKFKEENQVLFSFETLMDDDSIITSELHLMISNIKREVSWVLDFFFHS